MLKELLEVQEDGIQILQWSMCLTERTGYGEWQENTGPESEPGVDNQRGCDSYCGGTHWPGEWGRATPGETDSMALHVKERVGGDRTDIFRRKGTKVNPVSWWERSPGMYHEEVLRISEAEVVLGLCSKVLALRACMVASVRRVEKLPHVGCSQFQLAPKQTHQWPPANIS